MILVRREGTEEKYSYEQFIRAIQEGRVRSDTMVWSDVLTSGVWKPAGELQFFRSWAPKEPGASFTRSAPQAQRPAEPPTSRSAPDAEMPAEQSEPEPSEQTTDHRPNVGTSPWIPYGYDTETRSSQAAGDGHSTPHSAGGAGPAGGFAWAQSFSGDIPPGAPLPWEEMDKHGFFRAVTRTIRLGFADPEEFYRRVGRGKAIMPALVFGIVFSAFAAVVESLYNVAILRFFSDMIETYQSQLPEFLQMGEQPSLRETLLMRGIFLLVYPLGAFLGAGLIHAMLRTFGRPLRDFRTTFRMVNYASVMDVLILLPFCGNLLAAVWELVLLVRGLSRLHGMRMVATLAAVLLPGILLMCLWIQAMLLSGVMEGISGLARS